MRVRSDRQRLDELEGRSFIGVQHFIQLKHAQAGALDQRLKSLNPYGVLQRGYAIVTNSASEIIHSVDQTFQNDELTIRVSDGVISTRVSAEPQKTRQEVDFMAEKENEIKGLTYEQAFAELETVVETLESGQLPLEQALTLYERGQLLAQFCGNLLDQAELKIRQLNPAGKTSAGEIE